jgi:hypothetical protein
LPEIQALEVVLSRKTPYREREVHINTYDFLGNLIREIKVEDFGESGQEILDGLLVQKGNYQNVMIGAFGKDRRSSYLGMYIMEINEFGEYEFKIYMLISRISTITLMKNLEAEEIRKYRRIWEKRKSPRSEIIMQYVIFSKLQIHITYILINSQSTIRAEGTIFSLPPQVIDTILGIERDTIRMFGICWRRIVSIGQQASINRPFQSINMSLHIS